MHVLGLRYANTAVAIKHKYDDYDRLEDHDRLEDWFIMY